MLFAAHTLIMKERKNLTNQSKLLGAAAFAAAFGAAGALGLEAGEGAGAFNRDW